MSGDYTSSAALFPDPFLDMASSALPRADAPTLMDMCERMWYKDGTYRMAAHRVAAYFITKLEFEGISPEQRKKLLYFFETRFRLIEKLLLLGDDYMAYGMSHSSIWLPFKRFLICSVCHTQQYIDAADWGFENWVFHAHCPKCKKKTRHTHLDRRTQEEAKIGMVRWAPQRIRISYHPMSQNKTFYWDIPSSFRAEIKRGTKFYVRDTPWEVIEAIRDNMFFEFNPGVVYEWSQQALAGIDTAGYGISPLLGTFAQSWYIRLLKRANEALASDYVVPTRIVTPAQAGEKDALIRQNLGAFTTRMKRMFAEHRRDPATVNFLPFPVEYQMLGGEANALSTPGLITGAVDEQLNALGVPAQFYKGDLQWQAMPSALRLFQQTWPQFTPAYNGFIEHAVSAICASQNWDRPERAYMDVPTMADDVELRQTWLQLAASNLVSKRTAFKPYNLSPEEEAQRIIQEQQTDVRLKEEAAADEEQRQISKSRMQQGGAAAQQGAAPGAPAGAGMGMGVSTTPQSAMTPDDRMAQADEMAQQLARMPESARRNEMRNIAKTDETLHALVVAKLKDVRQGAEAQGRDALASGQM